MPWECRSNEAGHPRMTTKLVEILRCPMGCGSRLDLSVRRQVGDDVRTGELTCGACGVAFPIERGIARLLPPDLRAAQAADAVTTKKRSEMKARDAQAKHYDQMWYLTLYGRVEIPMTLRQLQPLPQYRLLEGGCGTGRMTAAFAESCSELVSIDFSWKSLTACAAKLRLGKVRNVDLVQADLCRLPFAPECFDGVASCGVLEHIPSDDSRSAAVGQLTHVLKPGGRLVLSAYNHSLWTRLFDRREGEHPGGIYYYRFTKADLTDLLSRSIQVLRVSSALVYYHLATCLKAEGRR